MMWTSALETGVGKVDEQHKELFRRCDALLNASMNRQGKAKITETISFLEDYIGTHFRDEQQLQVSVNYPKAAVHKGYHDTYIQQFQALKQKINMEGPDALTSLLALNRSVVDWLVQHINVHDKEFAKYYKSLQK